MKHTLLTVSAILLLLLLLLAACEKNPDASTASQATADSGVPTFDTLPSSSDATQAIVSTNAPTLPASPVTSTAPVTTTAPVTSPTPVTTTAPVTSPVPVTTTAPTTTHAEPETVKNPWIITGDDSVELRARASTDADILAAIPRGETVDLLFFTGTFAKVRWIQQEGYVRANNLTLPDGQGSDADLSVITPVDNYSYDQMQTDLRTLSAQYPELFTLSSIGTSEEGRDLVLCILGNSAAQHKVFLQSSIHGREHIVTLLTVCEIDYILSHPEMKVDNSHTVAQLLEQVAFYIVPMSNPDGVTISQTATLPEAFQGVYANPQAIARSWKANAKGIDLNANFNADWERYNSVYESDAPAFAGYKGTAPESAAESKALAEYLRQNPFDVILSYHTSGSCIYWAYDIDNCPEVNALCKSLATKLSAQSAFYLGSQATTSTAGLKDYAIQSLHTTSLTIEFAVSSAPAPLSEFEQIWARGKHTLLTTAAWILEQSNR